MTKKFFTSDTHFGHGNIIKFCNRPFSSVEEMDETIISRWNATIGKHDLVYHLGDFSFHGGVDKTKDIISRLNGHKFLILGNHDKRIEGNKMLRSMFVRVVDYLEIHDILPTGEKKKLVLMHFPILSWHGARKGSWMLHGHCHGNMKYPFDGNIVDVGCDPWGFEPVTTEKIAKHFEEKEQLRSVA